MNDDEWISHGQVVALRIAEARDYEIMRVAVKVPTAHSVVLSNELQPPKWGAAVRVRFKRVIDTAAALPRRS